MLTNITKYIDIVIRDLAKHKSVMFIMLFI